MPDKPLSVRLDASLLKKLDKLAAATDRSRSFLITDAVKEYIASNDWQVEKIKKAIEAADRGEFASEEEVQTVFKKLRRHAG